MTEQQDEGSAGHFTHGPDPGRTAQPSGSRCSEHARGCPHLMGKEFTKALLVGVEPQAPWQAAWGGGRAASQAHPLLLSLQAWLTVQDSLLLKVFQGTVQLGRHSLNHRKV